MTNLSLAYDPGKEFQPPELILLVMRGGQVKRYRDTLLAQLFIIQGLIINIEQYAVIFFSTECLISFQFLSSCSAT